MQKIENLGFQGDISFLKVDAYVKEALKRLFNVDVDAVINDASKKIVHACTGKDAADGGLHPEKGLVLAQGESRAHYHAFRDPSKVDVFEATNDNTRIRLVVVKNLLPIEHEEHKPIAFDPEIYVQGFQYEYDYADEYRRLAD